MPDPVEKSAKRIPAKSEADLPVPDTLTLSINEVTTSVAVLPPVCTHIPVFEIEETPFIATPLKLIFEGENAVPPWLESKAPLTYELTAPPVIAVTGIVLKLYT